MADFLSGLVGHFCFRYVSGAIAPDSGTFGINGQLQGSPIGTKVAGFNNRPERALRFVRTNSNKVVVPNTGNVYDFTGDLSIALWLKVNSWFGSWDCVFSKGAASYRLARDHATSFLTFDCFPNNGVITNTAFATGKWYHVTCVRDAAEQEIRIYVNGVREGQRIVALPMGVSTDNFTMGDNLAPDAGRLFDGDYQDFRIYNRVLEDADVRAIYIWYLAGTNGGDELQKMIRTNSFALLNFKRNAVRHTVLNATANHAVPANLEVIGRSRNLPRYQGEDIDEYRVRVQDAYNKNLALGGVFDMIRVMEGLGASTLGVQYRFNSHVQGNKGDSSEGLFNLLTKSLASGAVCDGTYDCNFLVTGLLCDSPEANDIIFEIVQTPAISQAQEDEIRVNLDPIKRASAVILKILKLTP